MTDPFAMVRCRSAVCGLPSADSTAGVCYTEVTEFHLSEREASLFDLSITKILILAVLGLMIFGPEQLPRMAAQAGKALRDLRRMAENAKSDLTDSLGPDFKDFDFNDLNPKSFVRKHLIDGFDDDDDLSWSGPSGAAVTDIDSPNLGRTELGTDGDRAAFMRNGGVHDAPQFDVDAT